MGQVPEYLPDIQVCGTGPARVIMLLLQQLSKADVEGGFDVADGEALVRPFPTALHMTDDCKSSSKLYSEAN